MTRRNGWPRSDNYFPRAKTIADSKASLRFDVRHVRDDRVDALLSSARPAGEHEQTLFLRLRLQADPVAQMLISTGRAADYGLGELILTSEALRMALPQLNVPASLDANFNWVPPFSGFGMAGDLAECLSLWLPDAECMRVATDFVLAVTGGRYRDFEIHKTYFPWSEFFDQDHHGESGLADTTWLMVDRQNGDVSCLFSNVM